MNILNRATRLSLATTLSAGAFMMSASNGYADTTQPQATPPIAEYEIKGSETLSWDSNPLMLANRAKAIFGSTTSPEFIINRNTPLTSFSADTLIKENVFDDSDFNSTDFHENINLVRHMQQWSAGIQGNADYDTTRTSSITNYNLNLPAVRHTGLSATPDISYNPTSVDKITLTANATRSTYDNNAFVDYEVFSFTPSYQHNFDPMNTGIFTINAQRYQSLNSGNNSKVDTIGPSVGWITLLTPRFSIRVDAGAQQARQHATATSGSSSSWDYIFDGDLSFKGEQDTTHLIASRAQYPFDNGTETLLTTFLLTESHALNKMLSLEGQANYQFAKQPQQTAASINLDKEYGAGAGLTYHMFEHWDMKANYQYKEETLTGVTGNINDQTVMVSLSYHPFTQIQ